MGINEEKYLLFSCYLTETKKMFLNSFCVSSKKSKNVAWILFAKHCGNVDTIANAFVTILLADRT